MTPFFILYKDGSINRLIPANDSPLCDDLQATVRSKDVVIQPETGVSVRIFLPKITDPKQKMPLVIYIHGGAFCIGSARSSAFHNFISSVVEKTNFIAVSVDYRLAPENPFATTYDDSWAAFQWVISHANGKGPDSWLNNHADFTKVFIGGESAGANIANDVAVRAGVTQINTLGLYLVHPYFGIQNDALYNALNPTSTGGCFKDPRVNPLIDPRLKSMACKKVLFFVAEKDALKEGAMNYYEGLKKSEWNGKIDIMETKGEGHCFHFFNPMSEKTAALVNKLIDFLKQEYTKEVAVDMTPIFILYKDGSINRLVPPNDAPLCDDPQATVRSKDVVIQPETGVSVRIFLPKITDPKQKIPLVIYIHGGAYCIGSARSSTFHNFISSLFEKANFIAVSVDYRLAPENPFATTYDDSWAAFQWVISHASEKGPDSWLNNHADFTKLFIGGESAGANIANDVAVRAGVTQINILGLYLVHPYFGIQNDALYNALNPTNTGRCFEDPRINPLMDPRLKSMACKKALFLVAEKDPLKEGAMKYYEGLKKSEWNGEIDMMETKGEGHCYHFFNPVSEKTAALVTKLIDFLKQE